MKGKLLSIFTMLTLLVVLVPAAAVGADKPTKDAPPKQDTPNYNNGQALPFGQGEKLKGQPPIGPSKVGDSRIWLALNDYTGSIYLKNYTLRDVGQHVEVWVANNLDFPAGDCRNDGIRNVITDEQVAYLIDQFDNNIYAIESNWWSTPPERDGKNAILPQIFNGKHGKGGINIPDSTYNGEGDNIVVLVDNVRDDNYYDFDNENTLPYIAGFFYSTFDDYFDRTVMNIDVWDWVHRTGADPQHAPSIDPCTSAPARPFLYEGVFAHEYQHLLHHYTDPDETTWVNEGLSDFTEIITGYASPDLHVDEKGYESHTQAFLGWNSVFEANWNPIPRPSGPENSLTAWGDQGDGEILADYGHAMVFMNYVNSQGFDKDFFHAWQHNQTDGIAGLNATLADFGSGLTFADLFNNNKISALVDGYLDNGASLSGGTAADFQNAATEATIFFSDDANATPGAPPWGSDYIDLGAGNLISSIEFDGADVYTYPAGPEWVVDTDGYFTNPDAAGDNYGPNADVSIARDVTGHAGEVLSFDHYYAMELDWDFGFVQVSTDGGATWQSLACDGTTSQHDPGAISSIVANLPGYTDTAGSAVAPVQATCPALPAGSDYLAFRLMSDSGVEDDGWHVKNVQLDGADLGTPGDLSGWNNQKYFSPVALTFEFAVVGIKGTVDTYGDVTAGSSVQVIQPTLSSDNAYSLTGGEVASLAGYDQVVAIISGIPAEESSTLYQPYSLLVNGAERADGQ